MNNSIDKLGTSIGIRLYGTKIPWMHPLRLAVHYTMQEKLSSIPLIRGVIINKIYAEIKSPLLENLT
jgi:hypothetical protein